MAETKTCPFCAEEIRSEAVFCRHCRSRIEPTEISEWHRNHPETRIAGVCAALAHAFAIPVVAVRLGFIVFTIFLHVGILAYAGLWLVIPAAAGESSHAERALQWALDALHGKSCPRHASGRQRPCGPRASDPDEGRHSVS